MKKITLILSITLFMVLTLASCKSKTQEYRYEYDIPFEELFKYEYDEKGWKIYGFQPNSYIAYKNTDEYINMVFPKTYLGQPLWYFSSGSMEYNLRHQIETLTFQQEITIGQISNMNSLKKITFHSDVFVNNYSIHECSKLTSIEFLGKVISTRSDPFIVDCDSLEEINIPKGEIGRITEGPLNNVKTITLGEECTKPERFKDAVMFGELPKATDINLLGEMEINKNTLSNTKPSRYTFGKRVVFQFASLEEQKVYTKDLKIRITANYQEWKDYQTQMSSNFIWEDNGKDSSYFINCDNEKLRLYFNDSSDISGFNV